MGAKYELRGVWQQMRSEYYLHIDRLTLAGRR